jgi:hypothetical protein
MQCYCEIRHDAEVLCSNSDMHEFSSCVRTQLELLGFRMVTEARTAAALQILVTTMSWCP